MSEMNLLHGMDRIKSATASSPIAVFRCDMEDELNFVFAGTVKTQQLIHANDPNLIGVYDGSMNMDEIKARLRSELS